MALLHDAGMPETFTRRVRSLTPESKRVWGKMTVDQMLHHVNTSLAEAVGIYQAKRTIRGLPEWLIRFVILYGPWGKGAPTRPDMLVPGSERFDFAKEKQRCLDMLDRFTKTPLDAAWPRSANFAMTGKHWSHLQHRHLDHHLRQFSA